MSPKEISVNEDEALRKLWEARALLLDEHQAGKQSRELAEALSLIITAILWREEDLRQKEAPDGQS